MNYLALVNELKRKTFVPGAALTTLTGANEQLTRMAGWVSETWDVIQRSRPNWLWMMNEFTFQTVANTGAYTTATAGATDFSAWLEDTFTLYLTSTGKSGEQTIDPQDYYDWRQTWNFGANAAQRSQPTQWAERPWDSAILLAPVPNAVYTVNGLYTKKATTLSADTDTPGMPSEYHMLIVYGAMQSFGRGYAAQEILDEGLTNWNRLLSDLERNQLPKAKLA